MTSSWPAGSRGTGPPFMYDYVNRAGASITPSTMHIHNTAIAAFFRKYLLQRAISVFKWTLPDDWDEDYFKYVLYCWGYVGIINTRKFGTICQGCGLKGYNVFYRPAQIVVANPLITESAHGDKEYTIDKDCVVIKLNPDYSGLMDIVDYYADLLALCAEGVSINILNSKLSYVFFAENQTMAQTMKKLFDRVASGEPAVITDKRVLNADGTPAWSAFTQNVGQNYIADRIMVQMQTINSMFDTEIGIPNANTEKKERLITSEANANNVETYSKVGMWLQSMKKECEKARNMFGIDIDVEWRYPPKDGEMNACIPGIPEPVQVQPDTV